MAMLSARVISFTPATKPEPIFFLDWELWAKMTFVLTCAMLLTILAGCTKLWWKRRYVRKHEIADEEKKVRESERRQSGIEILATKFKNDIPFGIRALESNVQIDGIHVERNSLKASRDCSRSSGSFAESSLGSSLASLAPARLSPPASTALTQHSSAIPTNHSPTVAEGQTAPSLSRHATGSHNTYKPRRSSQLRMSSYGDTHYDIVALRQLEGIKTPPRTHRPRGTPVIIDSSSSSNLAGDERELPGLSGSDATLTEKTWNQTKTHTSVRFDLNDPRSPIKTVRTSGYAVVTNAILGSPSMRGYLAVAVESPDDMLRSDHFSTSQHSSIANSSSEQFIMTASNVPTSAVKPSLRRSSRQLDSSRGSYAMETHTLLSSDPDPLSMTEVARRSEPRYGAGIIHANKSIRKANSGFEVLPAGTFGEPVEFRAEEPQIDNCDMTTSQRSSFGLTKSSKRLSKNRPTNIKDKTRWSGTLGGDDRA